MIEDKKAMTQEELQDQSIDAATCYIKEKNMELMGTVDKLNISNSIAHGFFMGVRFAEERYGIKK